MKSTCSGVIVSAAQIKSPSFSRSRASTTITSPPRLSAASPGALPVMVIDQPTSVSISVATKFSGKKGPTAGMPQFYAIAEARGNSPRIQTARRNRVSECHFYESLLPVKFEKDDREDFRGDPILLSERGPLVTA